MKLSIIIKIIWILLLDKFISWYSIC